MAAKEIRKRRLKLEDAIRRGADPESITKKILSRDLNNPVVLKEKKDDYS